MSREGRDGRDDDFLEVPAAAYAAPFLDTTTASTGASTGDSSIIDTLSSALGDRYRVERELGRGGMATVFLARDIKHSRPVALKVLHPDAAPALGAERFVREIETVAGLSHPHILPLHDSGSVSGMLYYAMPYVEGESLRERLQREPQLPVPTAVAIVREVADALGFAHRRGVVHRDIKPANIMLTAAGGSSTSGAGSHALVADFGIARALAGVATAQPGGARTSDPLTVTGIALGTPAYMSPEQASGERDVDGRSDLYSLGCVFYEMLAGEPPFTGPTAQAVMTKRLSGPPPSVRRTRPNVDQKLDAVVARAMAPLPTDRFQTADEFLDALQRATSGVAVASARPSNQRVMAAVGALAVLAASVAAIAFWRGRSAVAPSATAIAVLPPAPVTADTALTRLGRELAITVSANLDGVGGIRVVDALGVLANVDAAAPPPSLDEARAFAKRVGAKSVVRGTLIPAGDSVRVEVALHDAVCTSGDCSQPLARVSVAAPRDDITGLTERTTWALLRGVWQREGAPTPSLASVTTRSIPALRAFLEGERAIVDGRWRAAPAMYERAFTEDSTFLLAYWRYSFAKAYWLEGVDPAITAKYRRGRGRFPTRDSLLIEAELSDSMSVRYARTKAAAERFPDYWPAWWTLSDRLTHETPLIGTTSRELRAALEHTIALNPRMSSAWTHLFWLSTWERDTVLADRVIRQLTALRYDTVSMREQGYDELYYFQAIAAAIHAGGILPDTAMREVGVRILASPPGPIDPLRVGLGMTQYSVAREELELSKRVIARTSEPTVAAGHSIAVAIAHASRGAWDSSLVAIDGYVSRVSDARAPLYAYRLAVVGAWLGAVTPDVASSRRPAVVRDSASLPPASRAELAWLDGILAVAKRDTRSLGVALRAVHGVDSTTSPMLERSLAAFADALAGQRDRAADSLVALERDRAERRLSRFGSDAHPFLTAVNRLAAGRWLRERGKPGDAARLLTWFEAVLVPMRTTRQANAALEGLGYLERARAAESLGQVDVARDYYQRFLVRYDAPTPLHQHLVQEGREALARLGRRGGRDEPRQ
jgi:hypothetical protein